jgi:hypothetical protein
MELENLMQQINSDNHSTHPITFQSIDAVRLMMRVKETNEETEGESWTWKESRAVCLTFRTKELSSHVYFCNMKIEVSTLVAAVRQCYKCGKFGHVSKFCTKERQCFSCEETKHERSCIKNA